MQELFTTFDIQADLKILIESNSDYYSRIISLREQPLHNDYQFSDIYSGRKYRDFIASLPNSQKHSYVTLVLNSDGSPIFKSSKFAIWPIQVSINEIPANIRMKKTITYSLWFGHDKPNMTYFLDPFVKYMNSLSANGIDCNINGNIKNIHPYVVCCCVDSVARAPMQGLIQFNGFFGYKCFAQQRKSCKVSFTG